MLNSRVTNSRVFLGTLRFPRVNSTSALCVCYRSVTSYPRGNRHNLCNFCHCSFSISITGTQFNFLLSSFVTRRQKTPQKYWQETRLVHFEGTDHILTVNWWQEQSTLTLWRVSWQLALNDTKPRPHSCQFTDMCNRDDLMRECRTVPDYATSKQRTVASDYFLDIWRSISIKFWG